MPGMAFLVGKATILIRDQIFIVLFLDFDSALPSPPPLFHFQHHSAFPPFPPLFLRRLITRPPSLMIFPCRNMGLFSSRLLCPRGSIRIP